MEKGATGVAFGGRVGAKAGGRGWSLFGARVHMGFFRGEKKNSGRAATSQVYSTFRSKQN